MNYSTLITVFTYGGMLLVAAGCYALHWGAACVWLGLCLFALACAVSVSRKEEKKNSDE